MKVLHLSDTTLSGAPLRLSNVFNKYSEHESRHMVWMPIVFDRVFPTDLISQHMTREEIEKWFEWADVIHYHNRYKRQMIFTKTGLTPPNKPSVIQIHSPRESENFKEELESGIPLAVIAQYHVRQWPELRFIVPNVVDIYDPSHMPIQKPTRLQPIVSYAPSNTSCKGWDNKSYGIVSPALKKLYMGTREINYQRITKMPFLECLKLKQNADIGIDEVSTGSYHMSSLEYLSMGVATIGYLDKECEKVVKDLTGASWLPWVQSSELAFNKDITKLVRNKNYADVGAKSRQWMETYWNPDALCTFWADLYGRL